MKRKLCQNLQFVIKSELKKRSKKVYSPADLSTLKNRFGNSNYCVTHNISEKLDTKCSLFNIFSKQRPSGPMLSISQNVHLYVRPSVRLSVCSLLRYRLTVFLPPLPEVGCPIFLEIRNPWGKVMERSGLRYEYFCLKIV